MAASPAPREVWRVQLDKLRVCIVLRVEPDRAYVAAGQSQDGGKTAVLVKPGTPDIDRQMDLRKDTYFRADGMYLVTRDLFVSKIGRCPARIFVEIAKVQPSDPADFVVVSGGENSASRKQISATTAVEVREE